ncbi:MAG: hypothetical protein IJ661_06185 [Lachnospiraceae bacterium]|nr:hypothetical protein [Lachnospiraceae bacterium]
MSTKINTFYNPSYAVGSNSKGNVTRNITPDTSNAEIRHEESATVEISSDGMNNYNNSLLKSNGEKRLSSKAQNYLDSLRKQYGDYDFIIADRGDDYRGLLKQSSKEISVVLSSSELERMAKDEKYASEKLNRVSTITNMTQRIMQEEGFVSAFGKNTENGQTLDKIAVSLDDDGTLSLITDYEEITLKMYEKMKEMREQRAEQHKEEGEGGSKSNSVTRRQVDEQLREKGAVGLEVYRDVPRWVGTNDEITGYALDFYQDAREFDISVDIAMGNGSYSSIDSSDVLKKLQDKYDGYKKLISEQYTGEELEQEMLKLNDDYKAIIDNYVVKPMDRAVQNENAINKIKEMFMNMYNRSAERHGKDFANREFMGDLSVFAKPIAENKEELSGLRSMVDQLKSMFDELNDDSHDKAANLFDSLLKGLQSVAGRNRVVAA